MFKVGDIVMTSATAVRKAGLLYKVTDVYEDNGYWQVKAKHLGGRDECMFRQQDLTVIPLAILSQETRHD